jgi:polyisoprenoid-binding protein YceI
MNRICISCVAAVAAFSGVAAVALSGNAPASAAPIAAPAAATTYGIDSGHSSVIFKVRHNKVSNFYGRFDQVSGTFELEEGGMFNIEIKADSVHTGNAQRDGHLKSPDFFSAKEFPTMVFKSKSIKSKGADALDVTGEVTFRGVTKPLTVTVKKTGTGESRGKSIAGMETTFTIKRSEFGSTYGAPDALSDEVEITVSLEGVVA